MRDRGAGILTSINFLRNSSLSVNQRHSHRASFEGSRSFTRLVRAANLVNPATKEHRASNRGVIAPPGTTTLSSRRNSCDGWACTIVDGCAQCATYENCGQRTLACTWCVHPLPPPAPLWGHHVHHPRPLSPSG